MAILIRITNVSAVFFKSFLNKPKTEPHALDFSDFICVPATIRHSWVPCFTPSRTDAPTECRHAYPKDVAVANRCVSMFRLAGIEATILARVNMAPRLTRSCYVVAMPIFRILFHDKTKLDDSVRGCHLLWLLNTAIQRHFLFVRD